MATPDRAANSRVDPSVAEVPRFAVQHYTVKDIGTMWKLSEDAVRKIFENEPGVLIFGEEKRNRYKRRYRTLRIPESVLERVYRRMSRV